MDKPPASPYAGRWVARLRGQIIAQGGTPEQALRAAQASRFKETPEIVYMPPDPPLALSPLLENLRTALPDQELYLVGGAVRDALLGRLSLDLDLVAPTQGIPLARRVARALSAAFFPLDADRDTGRVILTLPDGTRQKLDFSSYRGPTLEDDLRLRDFTINALALDLRTMTLLDPLGGAADLRARRLRACAPTAMRDDPLRILRGVRLATMLGFTIEAETRRAMRQAVPLLSQISPERLRDELFRLLESRQVSASLRALDMLGALPQILPELPALKGVEQPTPHIYDVWEHTLHVLDELERLLLALAPDYNPDDTSDLFTGLLSLRLGRYRQRYGEHLAQSLHIERSLRGLLFFTALYHDVAKPYTMTRDETGRIRFWGHDTQGAAIAQARARALALSNDEIDRLVTLIRHHMRLHYHFSRKEGENRDPSRRAIYRFFRDAGPAGPDLILLGLADLRATHGPALKQETWAAALDVCRIFLENYWERPEEVVSPPRLLDGHQLMQALHLPAGPLIGKVLEAIREAQATGQVSTPEQALEFARRWIEEQQTE